MVAEAGGEESLVEAALLTAEPSTEVEAIVAEIPFAVTDVVYTASKLLDDVRTI